MRKWVFGFFCILLGSCTPVNEPYERITVRYERITTADGTVETAATNIPAKTQNACPRFQVPEMVEVPTAPSFTGAQLGDPILVQNILIDYIKALKAHNALERARWKYQVDKYNECK